MQIQDERSSGLCSGYGTASASVRDGPFESMGEFVNNTRPLDDLIVTEQLANETFDQNNSTYTKMIQVAILLNKYYTPLLIIFGLIGNLLSVFVFYKSTLWFQSTSQYLSALAISDTIFLIELLAPWFNTIDILNLFNYQGFCQIIVFTTYASCSLSSWLIVAFTVERLVAVLYPLKRNVLCTVKRARTVIATLAIAAMLVNIPILGFVVPSKLDCNVNLEYVVLAAHFNTFDTVITFTLPMILTVVLNIVIMIVISRMRHVRERSQIRITQMLLSVSSVTILLNLPAYMMRLLVYAFKLDESENADLWAAVQQLTLLPFHTHFGIHFILYCMTGQNFRRALVQILTRKKRETFEEIALRPLGNVQPGTSSDQTPVNNTYASNTPKKSPHNRIMWEARHRDETKTRWVFKNKYIERNISDQRIEQQYNRRMLPAFSEIQRLSTLDRSPVHHQRDRNIPFNLFPLKKLMRSKKNTDKEEVKESRYN